MRGWKAFEIRGIPVRLHVSLLVALPYFMAILTWRFSSAASLAGLDPQALVLPPLAWGAILAFALFASVLAHELAHAIVARQSGASVRGILLLLFGGISFLNGTPRNEALVAAVGPIVSLGIAFVCFLGFGLTPETTPDLRFGMFYLTELNLTLALFNLLPAFPLDGGRVLRAVLARRVGLEKSTKIASIIGRVFAVGLLALGIYSVNVILVLIALFVFSASSAEMGVVRVKKNLEGRLAGDLMRAPPLLVSAGQSVGQVLAELRTRNDGLVGVVDTESKKFIGLAQVGALYRVPTSKKNLMPVGMLTRDETTCVYPHATGAEALDALIAAQFPIAVTDENGNLLGTIDFSDITRPRTPSPEPIERPAA